MPGDLGAAVLLMNMGGPDSLDAVSPFLVNLFSDQAIIGLPKAVRLPMARLLGARRARKVTSRYALIGGSSPIGRITAMQAGALGEALQGRGAFGPLLPAFRYWKPFIAESLARSVESGARSLVALSLYPQYCRATTGTCVSELSRHLPGTPFETAVTVVDSWPDNPGYLDSLARTVREAMDRVPAGRRDDTVVVFSAHGIPVRLVEKGDPYFDETIKTVAGVVDRLGGRPHVLAFQSRLGPLRWLEPTLADVLRQLARRGDPPLVVVPVSFVSDHVETLYELDIQHREIARGLGITVYERAPALNVRPDFIAALADIVLGAVEEKQDIFPDPKSKT